MEFTERMEAGRNNAAARRHRGLTTGKSAKGWNVKRSDPAADSWDASVILARGYWETAKHEAAQGFLRVAYPERFDCEDIPF